MSLHEKVILVTGAAGNLGQHTVRVCLQERAKVYAAVRKPAELQSLVEILPNPDNLKGGVYDLGRSDETDRMVEDAVLVFGALHAVINLVGGWAGGHPITETSDVTFDQMMALNVKTAWNVSRSAMRALGEEGGGAIVNVGAIWAHRMQGIEGTSAYVISKAAVLALNQSLAAEGRALGVRANAVAPGSMVPAGERSSDPKNAHLVPPEAVARAMAYLCSEGASSVTGTVIELPGN